MRHPENPAPAGPTLAVVGEAQAAGTAAWAAICSGQQVALSQGPRSDRSSTPSTIARVLAPDLDVPDRDQRPGAQPCVVPDDRPEATHWLVVTRSAALEETLAAHADRMAGQTILLAPGGFGGALRVGDWFAKQGLALPRVAETTGFPAMGIREGDHLRVRAVKRALPAAAYHPDRTAELVSEFRTWIPDLVASDLATTSLGNTNHLIHPPLVITNAVRIAREEPFTFYREGLADDVAGLLDAVDGERRAAVAALGGDDRSGRDWLVGFYGDQGMSGTTLVEALRSLPAFATTPSPPRLDYRYLTDDIPYGVAAWAALARRLGTPHRHLDALQTLASGLLGRPLDPPPGLVDAMTRRLVPPSAHLSTNSDDHLRPSVRH